MKSGLLFWKLQIKKYGKKLPVILLESLLFLLLLLVFGGYITKAVYGEKSISGIRIGIVSEEDDDMTGLLVGFVESMDSFQDSCSFILMEQEEAQKALSDGEIYAAVVLPEGVLDSILNGTNLPAQILLGHAYSQMETEVFEEVAKAGNRLLTVAQAGIYAADELCLNAGKPELIAEAEEMLNQAYLEYALERKAVFKLHEVQATGKTGLAAYYSVALLLVFLSFAGMVMGKYVTVKPTALSDILAVRKVGYLGQFLAEAAAFSGIFALLGTVLGIPVLIFAMRMEGRGLLQFSGVFLLFLLLFALGAFIRLILEIAGKESGGLGVGFGMLLLMMTASGLILPAAFLPTFMERIGKIVPYRMWLEALLAVVEKEHSGKQPVIQLLLAAGCLLAGGALFYIRKLRAGKRLNKREPLQVQKKEESGEMSGAERTCSFIDGLPTGIQLMAVLTKQYLIKYRAWFLVLFGIAVVLGISGGVTKETELTGISVGIYAEDEDGIRLFEQLKKEEGIFRFQLFDSKEEMLRQVENSSLECAYVLPEGFYENLVRGKMHRQIDLYYAPGAGAHKLSYEVVFSHLFALLSENVLETWFVQSSLAEENEAALSELLFLKEQYETNGSTFSFRFEKVEEGSVAEAVHQQADAVLNPLRGCIAATIFFLGLLGLGNCCDLWGTARMFPGRTAGKIRACSLHITVAGAILSGLVLLLVSGCFDRTQAGKELLGLFLYAVILEVYLWLLRGILRTPDRVYSVIPVLLPGSLLLSPVFIQIKTYVPAAAFLENLFPITWYLRLFL